MNQVHKKLLREKSATEISCHLLSQSSLLSTSLDVGPFLEGAISRILSGDNENNSTMDRSACLSMVVSYMQLNPADIIHRLGSLIERMPTLIEKASLSLNINEAVNTQMLLKEVVRASSVEQITHLSKILTKLITVASKVAVRDFSHSNFGLSILDALVSSKIRNLVAPNAKAIRKTCLQILMQSSVRPGSYYSSNLSVSLSSVYGYALSLEASDIWMNDWACLNEECLKILATIGLNGKTKTSSGKSGAVTPFQLFPNDFYVDVVNNATGAEKVLLVERLFVGLCNCLKQVLLSGCSSGFIRLELTSFMSVVSTVLALSLDISSKDPINLIESNEDVSPFDLCLIGSRLKIEVILVMTELMRIQHPTLIRHASALCRPINAILLRPDTKRVPELLSVSLDAVALAAKVFPAIIATNMNVSSAGLIDLFREEMSRVSSNAGMLVSAADSETQQAIDDSGTTPNLSTTNGVTHSTLSALVFNTCESVVLHAGSMLNTNARANIEATIGQGLICILKGTLSPQFSDRRVSRARCEPLRSDPALQAAVLRLATTEVQIPLPCSSRSGNIVVLKRACESCLRHPVTSTVAARGLLLVGCLLQPSSIALPPIPLVDVASSYLLSTEEASNRPLGLSKSSNIGNDCGDDSRSGSNSGNNSGDIFSGSNSTRSDGGGSSNGSSFLTRDYNNGRRVARQGDDNAVNKKQKKQKVEHLDLEREDKVDSEDSTVTPTPVPVAVGMGDGQVRNDAEATMQRTIASFVEVVGEISIPLDDEEKGEGQRLSDDGGGSDSDGSEGSLPDIDIEADPDM